MQDIRHTLNTLELQDNRIRHVPAESLQPYQVLERLDLSFNELTEAPDILYVTTTLKHLTLHANVIHDVTKLLQQNILESVDLSRNALTEFPLEDFLARALGNVSLVLSSNNLTSLPEPNINRLCMSQVGHNTGYSKNENEKKLYLTKRGPIFLLNWRFINQLHTVTSMCVTKLKP